MSGFNGRLELAGGTYPTWGGQERAHSVLRFFGLVLFVVFFFSFLPLSTFFSLFCSLGNNETTDPTLLHLSSFLIFSMTLFRFWFGFFFHCFVMLFPLLVCSNGMHVLYHCSSHWSLIQDMDENFSSETSWQDM